MSGTEPGIAADPRHLWRVFRGADDARYWKCVQCGAIGSEPLSLHGEQECP